MLILYSIILGIIMILILIFVIILYTCHQPSAIGGLVAVHHLEFTSTNPLRSRLARLLFINEGAHGGASTAQVDSQAEDGVGRGPSLEVVKMVGNTMVEHS